MGVHGPWDPETSPTDARVNLSLHPMRDAASDPVESFCSLNISLHRHQSLHRECFGTLGFVNNFSREEAMSSISPTSVGKFVCVFEAK